MQMLVEFYKVEVNKFLKFKMYKVRIELQMEFVGLIADFSSKLYNLV